MKKTKIDRLFSINKIKFWIHSLYTWGKNTGSLGYAVGPQVSL